jgi:hypothetical protein
MPWTELTEQRTEYSRTYQDADLDAHRAWNGCLAPIHYPSQLDSDRYDVPLHLEPQRVDNSKFDGWTVAQNGWHYALGAPAGAADGWVGFGGRQGAHWFLFRLARVGYLHNPSRSWQDIGGPPNYDRANLTYLTHQTTIGPDETPITNATSIAWTDIWTTPNAGSLSLQWRIDGHQLKEDVIINQAGREWLQANQPPATPLSETFFGFVFQLNWTDVPNIHLGEIIVDPNSDFNDDTAEPELRDAADKLLGFLPLSWVRTPLQAPAAPDAVRLRKRFWKDQDGNHYLLVGVRCDDLLLMHPGPLFFDPTVDTQIAATANDGRRYTGTNGFDTANDQAIGYLNDVCCYHMHAFLRWPSVTLGGTINTSYIQCYGAATQTGSPTLKVYGVDEDNPAAPTSAAEFDADPLTTAAVDWDALWNVGSWNQSPSLNTVFQELVDSYTIESEAVMLQIKNDGGTNVQYNSNTDYSTNSSYAAKLYVDYTTADGGFFGLAGALFGFLAKIAGAAGTPVLRRRREGY